MKNLHVTAFTIFPILALPVLWFSGVQVLSWLSEFEESGGAGLGLWGIVVFVMLIVSAGFLITFAYLSYRWIKVVLTSREVPYGEFIFRHNSDFVSNLIVIEVIAIVVALVIYVPGLRELLAQLGARL